MCPADSPCCVDAPRISELMEIEIPTFANFLRSTPGDLLRTYFIRSEIALPPEVPWSGPAPALGASLKTMIEAMDMEVQARVMSDADRVGAMADEPGDAAFFAVTKQAATLDQLPNSYARAVWLLLNAPADFEHAEQVRYADDRRYGRMWEAFVCEPGCTVAREGQTAEAFKRAIGERFGSRNVEIEVCNRFRPRLEKAEAELVQVAIYREGRTGERKAFVNGRLDRLPDRPVIEAAITYEAANGSIEVVATARETREDLVRLFAEHLLGTGFQGERLRVRQYSLNHLCKPFTFPTEPADNIEDVRVTSLRLMPLDTTGERVTLECMRGAKRNIWSMANSRFHEQDPLQSGYGVTQARFTIKFRTVPGARGGRTLPVTISMPKGCDLKDRTDRERLIGEKYLRRWSMLRDV